MFENKRTEWGGVEYSRLICSWLKVGGVIYGYGPLDAVGFHKWLKENCHCTDAEVHDIYLMAINGKLEYENDARKFLADDENVKAINQIKRKVRKECIMSKKNK